ncbi:MAG: DUF2333 family protein [SAR324 cluster bacterium]|nr:DUF2333 family protein [SAR324 cluster bacterium]
MRVRGASGLALVVIASVWLVISFLQSLKPEVPVAVERAGSAQGYRSVEMTALLMETQMEGFGGWLPNDLPLGPSYFLDNLPNFQLGVLQIVRHMSRVLRDNLSRQRTSDRVHPETDAAYSAYANDPLKWAFPSAEGAFGRGNESLRKFLGELGSSAHFYPRADNLVQLLEAFVSELGGVTTTLLKARTDEVAWSHIDDNFYRAQGVGYALLGMMTAVRGDFHSVLDDKNALEITDLIVDSLRESQFEPLIVTNGDKGGILANHSSNLKAYLDDARQKMNSLITMLRQG